MHADGAAPPEICLCQANFPALSAAAFVELAATAGAAAIDLHPRLTGETADEVVAAVEGSGLAVVLVSPLPDWWAQTEGGRRLPPDLAPLLEVAARTGGRIGVPSPLVAAGREPPAAAAIGAALAAICQKAADDGVAVAFEPVGRSVLVAGARGAVGDLDRARALIRSHGLPLELVADSYCLASSGVDLRQPWRTVSVCLVQLADWTGGDGPRLRPGIGTLPLADWLAVARGPLPAVGVEVFPLDDGGDPGRLAHELVAEAHELLVAAAAEGAA